MSNGACYFGSTPPFHLWCKQAALLRGQWCDDMPEKHNLITINQVFVSLMTSWGWNARRTEVTNFNWEIPASALTPWTPWLEVDHPWSLRLTCPARSLLCLRTSIGNRIKLLACYQHSNTGRMQHVVSRDISSTYETFRGTTTQVFYASVCLLNKHNSVARANVSSVCFCTQQTC